VCCLINNFTQIVIPAKAGIQRNQGLDSLIKSGNDTKKLEIFFTRDF
jgi:hypothetical protein